MSQWYERVRIYTLCVGISKQLAEQNPGESVFKCEDMAREFDMNQERSIRSDTREEQD